MTLLSIDDVHRLAGDLAMANSAIYVYRRFRDDPLVKALGFRKTPELIAAVHAADATEKPSLDVEVTGYAALVALVSSDRASKLEPYTLTGSGGLKWKHEILQIADERNRPRGTIEVVGKNGYRVNIGGEPMISISSGYRGRHVENVSQNVSSSSTNVKINLGEAGD